MKKKEAFFAFFSFDISNTLVLTILFPRPHSLLVVLVFNGCKACCYDTLYSVTIKSCFPRIHYSSR